MIEPLIAVDLGSHPAAVLVMGTANVPVLMAARRFSGQGVAVKVLAQIEEWLARCPGAVVYCEQTFTQRRQRKAFLRDVGRVQEAQAGFLEGALWGNTEVRRVPPCDGREADTAWLVFGRPEEGKGTKGEHLRDALAIALKALIRRSELVAAKAAGGRDG